MIIRHSTVLKRFAKYCQSQQQPTIANLAKENVLGYIDTKQNRVITTHGFRSTFRDWSADKTDYPREVCEHVLAHKLPNEVEAAYLRGAYLEKRKVLMADWAEFCIT